MHQAVEFIAIRGGYMPQRGRRPGPQTFGYGLTEIVLGAAVLAAHAEAKKRGRKRR